MGSDLVAAEASATADLAGHIALPGGNTASAMVLVEGAELKSSISAYPGVPRHVQTDRHGDFIIKSLDTRWLYDGCVFAPGCQLRRFTRVDPAAGPLNMTLEPANPASAPSGADLRR